MRLAYVTAPGKGATDRLLAIAADELRARGLRLAGVVQTNAERPQRYHCDMDLRLLPDGPVFNITQNLGENARGCRLDPDGLERAVASVSERVRQGADLLILNKFGKHEAEGRGFRPVIAEALSLGIPVVLGVNALNLDAFRAFVGGLAEELPADPAAISEWCTSSIVAAA